MTLRELLEYMLKSLYDGETQLVKTLPKLAKKANDEELRNIFERYSSQIRKQSERLENIFDLLELKVKKIPSGAVRGLVTDVDDIIKNIKGGGATDAAFLAAAQAIEAYEAANYSAAAAWAKLLELDDANDLLQETLDEEREISDELSELAVSRINERAMPGGSRSEVRKESESGHGEGEEQNSDEDEEDDEEIGGFEVESGGDK